LARGGLGVVRRVTGPLLATSFVLLLAVKVPHVGIEVNGARRWLGAGPVQFQPSELMKLALVLYAVRVLADRPQAVRSVRDLASPLGVVAGAALLLVASQPDLGTALVIAFTLTALLVAAGMPLRILVAGAAIGALLVALFAIAEPYRRARGAYAALLATGITALILSQALLNVFAVLGLAPLTGVPLPFISSGSSSLLVLLAGMGLLLNVAGGGQAHLEAVSQGSRRGAADPHRGGRDGRARRARAGGRRRAAS